jgi:rsbT co-antagonist protein RsbR
VEVGNCVTGLVKLGEYIIEHSYALSKELNEQIDKEFIEQEFSPEVFEGLNQWRAEFIRYLGEAIKANNKEVVWEQITQWATKTGEEAVKIDLPLDESLKTLTSYRNVIWSTINQVKNKIGYTLDDNISLNVIIGPIIDHVGYIFSTHYVNNFRRTMDLAQKSIQELSVPVISLTDHVAILPLIGEIDTYRSVILKDQSLKRCAELSVSYLIIDMSGVLMVDTMVANELFQVIDALKLIGVKTVMTGVRPDVAQAVVQIGIHFDDLVIKKNLKSAINYLSELTI